MKKRTKKLFFVCTEDWFFYSHFQPLAEAAISSGNYDVSIVCGTAQKSKELEKLGLKTIPMDFSRKSLAIRPALKLLWQLVVLFRREKPDLIHFIALKPIVLGGMAALAAPGRACVYHLTGQGFFTVSKTPRARRIRAVFFKLVCFYLRRPRSWLVLENPDDRDALARYGRLPFSRSTIFGGAGVDPEAFPQLPPPDNDTLCVAFIGRMVWSKGVDVAVAAVDKLKKRGCDVMLDLYGVPDEGNPREIQAGTLKEWNGRENVRWHGLTSNVREVWAAADIAVVPSRGGEGLPRSLLEAAACARPLVVTDVPGCRHFVRDGIEGLVVPPEDSEALAAAIEKLAGDPGLRRRLGLAARKRVLEGYTEDHVRKLTLNIYSELLKPDDA